MTEAEELLRLRCYYLDLIIDAERSIKDIDWRLDILESCELEEDLDQAAEKVKEKAR